jgi:hypothetical protein
MLRIFQEPEKSNDFGRVFPKTSTGFEPAKSDARGQHANN